MSQRTLSLTGSSPGVVAYCVSGAWLLGGNRGVRVCQARIQYEVMAENRRWRNQHGIVRSNYGARHRMTAAGCEVARRSCYPEKASRACGPGAFPVGEADAHPGPCAASESARVERVLTCWAALARRRLFHRQNGEAGGVGGAPSQGTPALEPPVTAAFRCDSACHPLLPSPHGCENPILPYEYHLCEVSPRWMAL